MIIIDEVIISDELVSEQFACNIIKCSGACCWEGDYGAPVEKEEIELIETHYETIKPLLPDDAQDRIEQAGLLDRYSKKKFLGTQLMPDGACVFLYKNNGIAYCAFEKAYAEGLIDFKKPISCHLYPIRVEKNERTGFESLNYDKWEICSDACDKGKKEGILVYEFVKDALIRKYGEEFYNELDRLAKINK